MNDYNCAVELGTVRFGPTLVDVGDINKKAHTRLTLNVKRPGKKQKAVFDVRAYGEMGNDIYQNVKNGDRILVEGPVYASGYTGQDGQPKASLFLYVWKWMPDPVSTEMKSMENNATNGGKTETAVEEFGDNDEMLF